MEIEHLLFLSKCSIFHNIFNCMIFQRHQKALLWSKGLRKLETGTFETLKWTQGSHLKSIYYCYLTVFVINIHTDIIIISYL